MQQIDENPVFRQLVAGAPVNVDHPEFSGDAAVWLINGYVPGKLAVGAAATAGNGARPHPASGPMGIMHTALGNGISDYLTGAKDAVTALADIEAAYLISAKEAGLVK